MYVNTKSTAATKSATTIDLYDIETDIRLATANANSIAARLHSRRVDMTSTGIEKEHERLMTPVRTTIAGIEKDLKRLADGMEKMEGALMRRHFPEPKTDNARVADELRVNRILDRGLDSNRAVEIITANEGQTFTGILIDEVVARGIVSMDGIIQAMRAVDSFDQTYQTITASIPTAFSVLEIGLDEARRATALANVNSNTHAGMQPGSRDRGLLPGAYQVALKEIIPSTCKVDTATGVVTHSEMMKRYTGGWKQKNTDMVQPVDATAPIPLPNGETVTPSPTGVATGTITT